MSISSDMPTRDPLRRRGLLKARLTSKLYQVDFGRGSEWAYWEGTDLLTLGKEVTCEFDPTIPAWQVIS